MSTGFGISNQQTYEAASRERTFARFSKVCFTVQIAVLLFAKVYSDIHQEFEAEISSILLSLAGALVSRHGGAPVFLVRLNV